MSTEPLRSSGNVVRQAAPRSNRLTSVNGISIGTPMLTLPCVKLRHDLDLRRERTSRLGFRRHDPGFRLDPDRQIDRRRIDARLRRKAAQRA